MIRARRRCPRQKRSRASAEPPARTGVVAGEMRRILVIANETADGPPPSRAPRACTPRAASGLRGLSRAQQPASPLAVGRGRRPDARRAAPGGLAGRARPRGSSPMAWSATPIRSSRSPMLCASSPPTSDRLDAPAGAFQLARARCHRPSASSLTGPGDHVVASSKSPPLSPARRWSPRARGRRRSRR